MEFMDQIGQLSMGVGAKAAGYSLNSGTCPSKYTTLCMSVVLCDTYTCTNTASCQTATFNCSNSVTCNPGSSFSCGSAQYLCIDEDICGGYGSGGGGC